MTQCSRNSLFLPTAAHSKTEPIMNSITHCLRRFCGLSLPAFSLLALALGQPAQAGGVHDVPLTSVPIARTPITIDGSLADWPDTHPVTFVPLDPGLVKANSGPGAAAIAQLRRRPDSAGLQACYDSKALYFAVVWRGAAHGAGGLTLDVQTDRIAHVRLAPAGPKGVLQERLGDAPNWKTLGAGAKYAAAARPDGTWTEEIRIPWQDLTTSGIAPVKLTLAADLEWPQLTESFLRALPGGVRHDNTHLTACFLTSSDRLFGRDSYLGNSNDWGDLKFVAEPHDNATQTSALATGATETYIPQVAAPVALDGSLTGWNPAQFQTVACAPGLIGDRYSAKIAASYDADFLYLAAHVKSLGGPLNTEPEATQAGFCRRRLPTSAPQ